MLNLACTIMYHATHAYTRDKYLSVTPLEKVCDVNDSSKVLSSRGMANNLSESGDTAKNAENQGWLQSRLLRGGMNNSKYADRHNDSPTFSCTQQLATSQRQN